MVPILLLTSTFENVGLLNYTCLFLDTILIIVFNICKSLRKVKSEILVGSVSIVINLPQVLKLQ